MKMTLGEMIKHFRIEKEVKEEEICEGLCARTLISHFETGRVSPDILLFNRLTERMGVSPEMFALMVTKKEYEYYLWQEKVTVAVEEQRWEVVGRLLNSSVALENECNQVLVRQFYDYMKAMYVAVVKDGHHEAAELIKGAITQTIPSIYEVLKKKVFLGITEIHMLILYLYYGIRGNVLDTASGRYLFDAIEKYISDGRLETAERAKIYPKLVCVGMLVLKDTFTNKELLCMHEKAINLLRKDKTFYDITALLGNYIELLRKTDGKEIKFYEKQCETFKDILKDNGIDESFRPEVLPVRKPRIYLIHEYLYSMRKEKSLTQMDVSEGICEPETYSRVERGKRAPSIRNFKALAEKLGINWHYFRGELDTTELKAYQLRRKQRDAEIEGRYEECLEILQELEQILDMERPLNRQSVKRAEYVIKHFLGQITAEEVYVELKELLELTTEIKSDSQYMMYYTQTELEIIGELAQMLREEKKYAEGIELLELVLGQMKRSKVKWEQQWNGVDFILRIFGDLLFDAKEYKREREILKYVYKTNVKIRSGANIPTTLDCIADNLEHTGERYINEYQKIYRQTYYVSDFYNLNHIKEFTDGYYKEKFDTDICWY